MGQQLSSLKSEILSDFAVYSYMLKNLAAFLK